MAQPRFGEGIGSLLSGMLQRSGSTRTEKPTSASLGQAAQDDPIGYTFGSSDGQNQNADATRMRRSMRASAEEGFRLRDEEDEGIENAQNLVRQWLPQVMESPLNQRDVGDLYAGMLEDVAQQKSRDMMALSEYTGQTGMRGGVQADLYNQAESNAYSAITRGMRDVRKDVANVQMQHKMLQNQAMLGAAQVEAISPSTLGLQSLFAGVEGFGNLYAAQMQVQAAEKSAEAQQDSALLGGALGVVGSVLGGLF